jgi:hypothetical protein
MKTLQLFTPRIRKSGITKRREAINDLFLTTIYAKPLIKNVYDCVNKIVVDHSKAKIETTSLFNRISKN